MDIDTKIRFCNEINSFFLDRGNFKINENSLPNFTNRDIIYSSSFNNFCKNNIKELRILFKNVMLSIPFEYQKYFYFKFNEFCYFIFKNKEKK